MPNSPVRAERIDPPEMLLALSYADAGFRVFPCVPSGGRAKEPCEEGWRTKASSVRDAVRAMWMRHPGSVVGLPTGSTNGISVLDVDKGYDKDGNAFDGHDSLSDLVAQGKFTMPNYFMVVETPRGGRHYFVKTGDAETRNNTNGIGSILNVPNVDVRGSGGYVVAAGSHLSYHKDGQHIEGTYRVIGQAPSSKGEVDALPIDTCFANLIRRSSGSLTPANDNPANDNAQVATVIASPLTPGGSSSGFAPLPDWTPNPALAAYGRAVLGGIESDLSLVTSGRNDSINRAAFRAARYARQGLLDVRDVESALYRASVANGYVAKHGREGERKARASIRSGIQAVQRGQGDRIDMSAIDLAVGYDPDASCVEAFCEGRATIDPETGEFLEDQSVNNRTAPRKRVDLDTVNAADFAGVAIPVQKWLVDGLIPAGNITLLMGDGGTGKSLLALQLAVATATGRSWIGFQPGEGRVLFLSAEDETEELHRRLARIEPDLARLGNLIIAPLAGKDAVLAVPDATGTMKPTQLFGALRRAIFAQRPSLLVLDTLADLFGGDEIKKVQARSFISLLRSLALDFSMTILLLGHPSQSGMASGDGTSGNVAWSNSVRSRLFFERRTTRDGNRTIEEDRDVRLLTTKKNNRGEVGKQIVVRWQDGQFVREAASTLDARDAAAHVERVFVKLLALHDRLGRPVTDRPSSTYAPKVFAAHPDGEGIGKIHFARAMERLLRDGRITIDEWGPPSRRRSRLVVSVGGGGDDWLQLDGQPDDARGV